jgi:hypothetical protein
LRCTHMAREIQDSTLEEGHACSLTNMIQES